MRLLIIILLVGLPVAASGWYGDKRNTPHDEELMHAFACGYLFGKEGMQIENCKDLREIAARHGFKF